MPCVDLVTNVASEEDEAQGRPTHSVLPSKTKPCFQMGTTSALEGVDEVTQQAAKASPLMGRRGGDDDREIADGGARSGARLRGAPGRAG